AHLPLQGVANRDLAERWSKWRKRRPQALRLATLGVLMLTALASGMVVWELSLRQQHGLAEGAREEGEELLARGDADAAERAFHRGLAAGWFPGDAPLRRRLADLAGKAARAARERRQEKTR